MSTLVELARDAFEKYDGSETLADYDKATKAGHYTNAEEAYASARGTDVAWLAASHVPAYRVGAWEALYRIGRDLGLKEARRQRLELTRAAFPPKGAA